MSQFQQLDQLMERQDGMLRTGQALAAGISKPVFYQFVQSRGLEQAAHGIYLSKDAWVDAMYPVSYTHLDVYKRQLEVLDEDGRLERKADMFIKRTIKPHEAVTTVDTASEALARQMTGQPVQDGSCLLYTSRCV